MVTNVRRFQSLGTERKSSDLQGFGTKGTLGYAVGYGGRYAADPYGVRLGRTTQASSRRVPWR
jgi:hypothetical protein